MKKKNCAASHLHDREGGRLPVIVHLHGGGFCISHPSWLMYHHFYSRLACAVPAVVVYVELPLAPERRRLPAHIDTGVAALCSIALSEDGDALDDLAAALLREAAGAKPLVHFVAARMGEDGTDSWAPLCHSVSLVASRSTQVRAHHPEQVGARDEEGLAARAGKDVEVLLSRGMSHAFYLNKFPIDMDASTGERTQELMIDAFTSFVAHH